MIPLIILSVLALFMVYMKFKTQEGIYGVIAAGLFIGFAIMTTNYPALLIFSVLMSFYLFYDTFIGRY